jgi:lactate permease
LVNEIHQYETLEFFRNQFKESVMPSQLLLAGLAILPIAVIAVFLVGLRWPAKRVMPLALVSVALSAAFVWKIPLPLLAAQTVDGIFTAVGILYIVFGALVLLNTLKEDGALSVIRSTFTGVSTDRRIQAIIILWLFGAFLEGAAGFGSTGAVIGPLFLGIGFPPMAAAMLCMIFQSTSVSFGAVGTPILIGISVGLGQGHLPDIATNGLSWSAYINDLGLRVAAIHGVVSVFVPLIMVSMMTRFFGSERSFLPGLRAWKFALFGGVCLAVPYYLTARFLGPEFPDVLGGMIGLIPATLAARKGWFLPADGGWDFPDRSAWDARWEGTMKVDEELPSGTMSPLRAWFPYVAMAAILFLSRVDALPLKHWLLALTVKTTPLFGTTVVSALQLGYLPGTIFILAAFIAVLVHGAPLRTIRTAAGSAFAIVVGASTALLVAVPMVKIFIGSGAGLESFPAMPNVLAQVFADSFGSIWPAMSAVIGAMGAFIGGSNTLSNMMFSLFQYKVAVISHLDPEWIVAVQGVGAAAGNMICVHNVIMASAAVGLLGREGDIIRKTIFPACYYILGAGAAGYIMTQGWGFNFGTVYILAIAVTFFSAIYLASKSQRTH